jgi:hypothetical protein
MSHEFNPIPGLDKVIPAQPPPEAPAQPDSLCTPQPQPSAPSPTPYAPGAQPAPSLQPSDQAAAPNLDQKIALVEPQRDGPCTAEAASATSQSDPKSGGDQPTSGDTEPVVTGEEVGAAQTVLGQHEQPEGAAPGEGEIGDTGPNEASQAESGASWDVSTTPEGGTDGGTGTGEPQTPPLEPAHKKPSTVQETVLSDETFPKVVAERDRLRKKNDRLRKENNRLAAEKAVYGTKNRKLRKEIQERSKENDTLRSENFGLEREKKRFQEQLRKLAVDNEWLRAANVRLGDRAKDLKKQLAEAQAELERADLEMKEMRAEIERLRALIKPEAGTWRLLSQPHVQKWLVKPRTKKGLPLRGGVVVIGSDPVPTRAIERQLMGAGLRVSKTISRDCGLMVVGREDWMFDDLEDQIRVRAGHELKIYSQEMMVAALATRDDPFETADRSTLMEFVDCHPALTYLIEAGFDWPTITADPLHRLDKFEFAEESPLKKMGYVVGRTHGLPQSERRSILERAFNGKLPPTVSPDYMATWGLPSTWLRLRRMARLIAWLGTTHQTMPGHETAVDHWEADLDWLRGAFYADCMRFRWPSVRA